MVLAWLRIFAVSIAVLFTYIVLWNICIFASSRGRVAHGAGYYAGQSVHFFVTGLMFIGFGMFLRLHFRR